MPRSSPVTRKPTATVMAKPKAINLALQGGGSHGAFTWGVLDALLADGGLHIDAVSATSAGSLNAVALADGLRRGGPDGARQALHELWSAVAQAGRVNPLLPAPWLETFMHGLSHALPPEWSPLQMWASAMTQLLSPYQFNPLNINPLRAIVQSQFDFDALQQDAPFKLFLSATNVETGKIRVFTGSGITPDAVLASACLPTLFQAVEIEGEFFWDGGFMGNPAIFPLIYADVAADVLIVHVNPVLRKGVPRSAAEIANRVNEISFNSSLMREMRAIAFVTGLIDRGRLDPHDARRMRIHSVRCDALMAAQGVTTKMDTDWAFLCRLRDAGRAQAQAWLAQHLDEVGQQSSVDIRAEFL
ncbi:patatin-like phospholipase family protein [Paucibacter sp. KCTC 42545]|uniref:patatin-like phospholipase family protein n=1 Tax=Paucibacter sp. KCTC 42545 TaxID=1768242 RepID=UPI000B08D417